jgi:hypothetical protein
MSSMVMAMVSLNNHVAKVVMWINHWANDVMDVDVLLSVHKSLNAHINFPIIVRISTFYSQYTSH